MRAYDASLPLVSLHIPKTAGTSFRATLEQWFPGALKLHYAEQGTPPALHALEAGECVHGHFNRLRGIGAADYYPEVEQYIMFVRRPFERAVSQWKYLQYQLQSGWPLPALAGIDTFQDWIAMRRERFDPLSDPYSMFAHLPVATALDDLASLFDEKFVGLGAVEEYPYALVRIGAALGKTGSAIHYLNDARKGGDLGLIERDFDAFFESEMHLYEVALQAGSAHVQARLVGA